MTSDDGTMVSRNRTAWLLALAAIALGVYAAWFYHQAGLTLSHYDTKGHLVVARRVMDSLTPGWKQIGAVWLPLPHLLNLLPVQIDWCYRTGISAVALSVLAFGLVVYACARLVLHATGSRLAAAGASLVVGLNPDMLYLQATPMTEPLLLAFTTLGIVMLAEWADDETASRRRKAGLVLAAACLTRYEAWPLTVAALGVTTLSLWRRGVPLWVAVRRVAGIAVYPLVAGLAFLVQSRLTVGQWFVTGGFYVPDNLDKGRPFKSIGSIWWASHVMNGYGILLFATAGALAAAVCGLARRARASLFIVLALAATAALPWYAFYSGHPFRYRYMVPLVPALAVFAGCAIGLSPRRWRVVAAAVLGVLLAVETRPFDQAAPMVQEAQLDRAHSVDRRKVTAYLTGHRHGGKVLVSFGSLSHYVHELSRAGFAIRDFVHEGNGVLWGAAVERPALHVEWVLIEELAEGGDDLAKRARRDARFLEGFRRAAQGGGVALYERERGTGN